MKSLLLFFAAILFLITTSDSQTTLKFNDLPNMPTARGAITSVADDNNIYVINGFSVKHRCSEAIEKYNVENNSWSSLTSSIIPKQFPSSAILGDSLYIFNGDKCDHTLNNKMEVVNLTTGAVTLTTDNPQPAHAAGVVTWKGNIYFFGGNISPEKAKYSDKLFRFDPSTQQWKELHKMPEAKETKGIVADGKLYVVGGYSGKAHSEIEMYDFEKDKWTKLAKLPFAISANSVVAYDSKIYTLFDFTNQSLVGCYDIPSNKFTVIKAENMVARRHGGAHIINDKLYIVGGNTSEAINSCLSSLQSADLK